MDDADEQPPALSRAAVPVQAALRRRVSVTPPPVVGPFRPAPTEAPDLRRPSLYLNRELSWLEFNARVLAEADSEAVPLLERLKFHAIVASNLDEFFMVRVAGLKQQLTGEVDEMGPDGMTVGEQLAAISARVHELVAAQSARPGGAAAPSWPRRASSSSSRPSSPPQALAELDARFHNEVFPILTPIAIDPGHPVPAGAQQEPEPRRHVHARGLARARLRRRPGARRCCRASSRWRA